MNPIPLVIALFRFIGNAVDIRRRTWWMAALMFYGVLVLAVMSGISVHVLKQQTDLYRIRIATIQMSDYERKAITQSLSVAYGMSEQSAEFYAYVYKKVANKYVLPWQAFAAITCIESRFDVMAKSKSGACGLMQLLEPTAEEQCRKLKIPYKKNATVWNAVSNICMGAEYFNVCYRNGVKDPDERLEEAIKRYLGGSKYRNYADQNMIEQYLRDVMQEYTKLTYIYKGIMSSYKGVVDESGANILTCK